MALWFAVIRAREMMQKSSNKTMYASNRWATKAQTNKRHAINLDEAFSEQWQENYG